MAPLDVDSELPVHARQNASNPLVAELIHLQVVDITIVPSQQESIPNCFPTSKSCLPSSRSRLNKSVQLYRPSLQNHTGFPVVSALPFRYCTVIMPLYVPRSAEQDGVEFLSAGVCRKCWSWRWPMSGWSFPVRSREVACISEAEIIIVARVIHYGEKLCSIFTDPQVNPSTGQ